ncbi:MAG: cell wall hydrolase, partial [Firmicutes bacterium]|nr:cell wall hydrolase [Bacillota bacterium]
MRVWFFTVKQVLGWSLTCLAVGIYFGTAGSDLSVVFRAQPVSAVSGKIIVIDAGHGGIDPGAVSAQGILEKTIALDIAKKLERLLQRAAVFVIMVRRDDRDLVSEPAGLNLLERKRRDLQKRVLLAEEAR